MPWVPQVHFEAAAVAPVHARHAGSFPASLLALVREQGVQQLELSLTRGRWVSGWRQGTVCLVLAIVNTPWLLHFGTRGRAVIPSNTAAPSTGVLAIRAPDAGLVAAAACFSSRRLQAPWAGAQS